MELTQADYSAIVVTYMRPESLASVLDSLRLQVALPSLTVVVDNDPERSAESVTERIADTWIGDLVYVAAQENLGPAGGWALAASVAQNRPDDRGEWILVIDDDDPIGGSSVLSDLIDVATSAPDTLGAIGLRGARLSRLRARLQRVVPVGSQPEPADYLASGGVPIYRWDAIDDVGFFEPELFFGFEDLDLGLRMQAAGWELLVAPNLTGHQVADSKTDRVAWREYYKNRALVWILKRHVGGASATVAVARSALAGGLLWSVRNRDCSILRARLYGAIDGWFGKLGRTRYVPDKNPPKR